MFWGIVSVLAGALLGYAALRNLLYLQLDLHWRIANSEVVWFMASVVPVSALAVYFVWVGKNQLQRAGGQEVPRPRFRWGRLLLGFYLTFFALKSHFAPGLNAFKADNDTEAMGMLGSTVVMTIVGALLMAFAFRPAQPKPTEQVPSTDAQ
jgi:hypothetical protein